MKIYLGVNLFSFIELETCVPFNTESSVSLVQKVVLYFFFLWWFPLFHFPWSLPLELLTCGSWFFWTTPRSCCFLALVYHAWDCINLALHPFISYSSYSIFLFSFWFLCQLSYFWHLRARFLFSVPFYSTLFMLHGCSAFFYNLFWSTILYMVWLPFFLVPFLPLFWSWELSNE